MKELAIVKKPVIKIEALEVSGLSVADKIIEHARKNFGYLTLEQVNTVLESAPEKYRLAQVYVRCGAGRFSCALQDLNFMIESVEKNGTYIRDVALRG
jgi:hypothetical protein